MTTLAFSYVAYNRLRFIWPGILMAVVLSLMSAQAWAVKCRFNDQAGPQEMLLNVGTIEVPETSDPAVLLWRSPLQRIQLSCFSRPTEPDNQQIVIRPFPEGHPSSYAANVDMTIESEGKTTTIAGSDINTGHFVRSGETKVITLEYYINLFSGRGWSQGAPRLPHYRIMALQVFGAAWFDDIAYHALNVNFIPRPQRTCELSTTDRNRNVILPVIGANRLTGESPTGGRVDFALRLSNCSAAVNRAEFTFSGQAAPGSTEYFSNRGTASGVALQLGMREGNQSIAPHGANSIASVAVTGQQATLLLFAQYTRTAQVTAGTFYTMAEFTLSYR